MPQTLSFVESLSINECDINVISTNISTECSVRYIYTTDGGCELSHPAVLIKSVRVRTMVLPFEGLVVELCNRKPQRT